jgi:hypothetical protein
MSEKNGSAPNPDSPFGKFKELTCKLVSVPKAEIDARERAAKRKKASKKRRSA